MVCAWDSHVPKVSHIFPCFTLVSHVVTKASLVIPLVPHGNEYRFNMGIYMDFICNAHMGICMGLSSSSNQVDFKRNKNGLTLTSIIHLDKKEKKKERTF